MRAAGLCAIVVGSFLPAIAVAEAALPLASADFNADGRPDFLSVAADSSRIEPRAGVIGAAVRDLAARYAAVRSVTPLTSLAPSIRVDFLGAGDFDADGHFDVLVASRDERELVFYSGNGRGQFGAARRLALPGALTALAVGEVNRADGLADIVAGVRGESNAHLLVFESADGALGAEPESFAAAGQINGIATGLLDESYEHDIAFVVGDQLIAIQGRDRRLSLPLAARAPVLTPQLSTRRLNFAAVQIAIGEFSAGWNGDIGLQAADGAVSLLVSARNQVALADRTLMDDARHLALLAQSRLTPQQQGMRRDDPTASAADAAAKGKPTKGKPSAPIDLSQWAESTTKASQLRHWPPLPLLLAAPKPIAAAGASKATFSVSTIADSGAGSLRQAIIDANARRPAIRSPAMSCSRRELPGMRCPSEAVLASASRAITSAPIRASTLRWPMQAASISWAPTPILQLAEPRLAPATSFPVIPYAGRSTIRASLFRKARRAP